MAKGDLTNRQKRFVSEYLIDLNGAQAATRAGYARKSARVAAAQLLANPNISDAIQEQMRAREARTLITADRVIAEFARVAFFDPSNVFGKDGKPLPVSQMDEDTRRAIAGLDVVFVGNSETGVGEVQKIKIANKLQALENLGKHLGIYEKDNKQPGEDAAKALSSVLDYCFGEGKITLP